MRIPPELLKSCFYIYPSRKSAENRERVGGSGFFFRDSSIGGREFIYAITNLHVIAHCTEFPAILVNGKDGKRYLPPIETKKSNWVAHRGGADVAICQVELPEDVDVGFVDRAINRDALTIENGHIGPGDSVYMIGRFTTHEFEDAIAPIVRYGNISLNPSEHTTVNNNVTGNDDEVFLVETRSFSGYSGSPVFVYLTRNDDRSRDNERSRFAYDGKVGFEMMHLLLGINLGHNTNYMPVVVKDEEYRKKHGQYPAVAVDNQQLLTEQNSGMMRIAPAWLIQEMLEYEEFKSVRDKQNEEDKDIEQASHVLDVSEHAERDSVNLVSREEFEVSLKEVVSRIDHPGSNHPECRDVPPTTK